MHLLDTLIKYAKPGELVHHNDKKHAYYVSIKIKVIKLITQSDNIFTISGSQSFKSFPLIARWQRMHFLPHERRGRVTQISLLLLNCHLDPLKICLFLQP